MKLTEPKEFSFVKIQHQKEEWKGFSRVKEVEVSEPTILDSYRSFLFNFNITYKFLFPNDPTNYRGRWGNGSYRYEA